MKLRCPKCKTPLSKIQLCFVVTVCEKCGTKMRTTPKVKS